MPAGAVAWLRRGVTVLAFAWVVVTGVLVTIACYLYLPVRGAVGAEPTWAETDTFGGALWYALARIFSASVGGHSDAGASIGGNAVKALFLLGGALTPVVVAAALVGTWLLARSGGIRWVVVLLLAIGGSLASKIGMGILDPSNPDDHGYFLVAVAGVSILAAVGGAALPILGRRLETAGRRVATACGIAILAAVALLPSVFCGADVAMARTALREPYDEARAVWESVPPRAVLMPSHFPVHFLLMYGQAAEGARPDVTLVHQTLYSKAREGLYYAALAARRDPDLKPLVERYLQRRVLDWDLLRAISLRRPVRLFPSDDLAIPLSDLAFDGWTFDVIPPGGESGVTAAATAAPSIPSGDPDVGRFLSSLRAATPDWPDVDIETRRVLLRHLATAGTWLAGQGHRDPAARLLDAALELNSRDTLLKHMRAALGDR